MQPFKYKTVLYSTITNSKTQNNNKMKVISSMAVLLTVFSASLFANEKELGNTTKFQVVQKSNVKYDLYYVSDSDSKVSVKIYGEGNKLISVDRIVKQKRFKRTYNFSKMSPGNYRIVIKNSEGSADQHITYKPELSVLKTIITKIPDSQKCKVIVGDFDKSWPVYISVYDEKDRRIHHDKISSETGFIKIYDLSKSKIKNATITVSNNNDIKSRSWD